MFNEDFSQQKKASASVLLEEAYADFILSRQAMLCRPRTVQFYEFTLNKFVGWLAGQGVEQADEISARHVRAYLSDLAGRDLTDTYIHSHARAIRTFVRFLYAEDYHPGEIKFQMPAIAKRRLPVLNSDELRKVVSVCSNPRDLALVLLMADTGVRRAELCALNWGDVDISRGTISIREGKGGKARTVIAGVRTRRALLKYRRLVASEPTSPVIQTKSGGRMTHGGLRSALLRLGEKAGVHLSPHTLRRTFATLSLRAGMNPLHLQGLLGHASLEMTNHYVHMLDEDLQVAHRSFGPIDNHL
ncbi:MAG: tyrosine-type recombinase/integrase [Anaerolineales bacterium]|nr:tyrosine-type recombinase/integrase [Anaerolineales bacterium]MCW5855112.1 tyrosine-type recombinase/integrase [Anaerolineales bacterium]